MSYKRIVITGYGSPDVLQLVNESELPEPNSGEVRVKILKTSANFTDVMIRKGLYFEVKEKPPFSLGYDMVGVVDKIGSGVDRFKTGDKVADMTVIGAYAEYICLPEERLIKVPDQVDASEAVALILSYTTAWQMLHRIANVPKNGSILIHGASGAVGTAMLQLGKLHGLTMYGTASGTKHDLVKKHGGIPIDYRNEDFVKRIHNLTTNGVDAAFDAIGWKNFKRSFKTLKPGGTLVAFGFYNAVMEKGGNIPLDYMKVKLLNISPNNRKARFYTIGGFHKKHPEMFKNDMHKLFELLSNGDIKPEISAHYPLDKAKEVHQIIESGNATGKGKIIFDVS